MKRSWRQTKDGLVEITASASVPSLSPSLRMDIEPFKSPIDGSIINTRAQLNAHNARHGVSNDLDSLRQKTDEYNKSRTGQMQGSKKERINALVEAYDRAAAGQGRHIQYHEDSQLQ